MDKYYIVVYSILHESGNYITNDHPTFQGLYKNYSDALLKVQKFIKENKMNGSDLFVNTTYEKEDCEIYAFGYDTDYSGEKISIFEALPH
jgi:hypothetical protein